MILVIDANPFIAGFLRDSSARLIMLSDNVRLNSPDWIKQEFGNNEEELVGKFPNSGKFSETKRMLFEFINIIPYKDVPYFALALKLNCAIWSDEKAFKKQPQVKVFNTSELLKELGLKK